jgi:aspartyl-tRNA synthetase
LTGRRASKRLKTGRPVGAAMTLRTLGCGEVKPDHYGTTHTFAGWVHSLRVKGNIAFLELRDKTGHVQFVLLRKKLDEDAPGLFETLTALSDESCVSITGTIQPSVKARAGFEVLPTAAQVLNAAAAPLPMALWDDAIETGLDTRLDNRFLDARTPHTAAIFRIRHAVLQAGRAYLTEHGFTEIHTSNIIAASSEGGSDTYKVDWFGKECFLSQSPQLYKQMMMASGFDRVFEIARYFRAEKHNTTRHLNESTALDLELAWIESEEDVMQVVEGLLHAIWKAIAESCADDVATLGADVSVPQVPFRRVAYTEAVGIINKRAGDRLKAAIGKPKLEFGDDIGTEAEKILGEAMHGDGHDFYFITKWPLGPKPFYVMPEPLGAEPGRAGPASGVSSAGDAMLLSRSFDLDYRGVELISGAQRVHDPVALAAGIERWGLDPQDFTSYLDAFRYGMPPHGGCGIGIERILMQMLGLGNIREAILFPRDMTRVTP